LFADERLRSLVGLRFRSLEVKSVETQWLPLLPCPVAWLPELPEAGSGGEAHAGSLRVLAAARSAGSLATGVYTGIGVKSGS